MHIRLEENELRSIAIIDDKIIGECRYHEDDSTINIYHTFVDENYRGQGIASKLVEVIKNHANSLNKSLTAQCSYVNKHK